MLAVLIGAVLGVLVARWLRASSIARTQSEVRARLSITLAGIASLLMLVLLLAAVGARVGPVAALAGAAALVLWVGALLRFILPGGGSGSHDPAVEPEPDDWRQLSPHGEIVTLGTQPVQSAAEEVNELRETTAAATSAAGGYVHVPLWKRMRDEEMFRVHCRRCGGALTVPLCEVSAPTPAAFYGRQPPNWVSRGWIKMLSPPYGTFWRSFSEWPSNDGTNIIGGVDFGTDGRVLMFDSDVLAGTILPVRFRDSSRKGGCCGYVGTTGPNLRCHGCGEWVLICVADCDLPSFTAARLEDVELKRATVDSPEEPRAVPEVFSAPVVIRCRRCRFKLSRPLEELESNRPPLFRNESQVDPADATGALPRPGTFWRSFSTWQGVEGECALGGVDFGSAGEVLMADWWDTLGVTFTHLGVLNYRDLPPVSRGDDGPNRICHRCEFGLATRVYGEEFGDFIAFDLKDVDFEETSLEEFRKNEEEDRKWRRKRAEEARRARSSGASSSSSRALVKWDDVISTPEGRRSPNRGE